MNILLLITTLRKGGAEKNFAYLCTNLLKMEPPVTPIVISIFDGYYHDALKKRNVLTFVIGEGNFLLRIRKILECAAFIIKNRKTISVSNAFLNHAGAIGTIIKIMTGIPFIYSIRNTYSIEHPFFANPISYVCHNIAVKFADIITCNSLYVFNKINKLYPSKRVRLIQNAIEISNKPSDHILEEVKEKYFRGTYKLYAITTCNLRNKGKDIETLLKVAGKFSQIGFVIVGGGVLLEKYRNTAKQARLSNVSFTGHQDNVIPFLFLSDIFILLTLHEGFPNSVLEAMASQLPVIASNIPQISCVLEDRVDCLLVENGNVDNICQAINTLLLDSNTYNSLITNALQKLRRVFSPEIMMAEYIKLYNFYSKKPFNVSMDI